MVSFEDLKHFSILIGATLDGKNLLSSESKSFPLRAAPLKRGLYSILLHEATNTVVPKTFYDTESNLYHE